jgi:hypothetical protein
MRKVVFALAMLAAVTFASCGSNTESSTPAVADTTMVAPATVDTVTATVDTATHAVDSTHK